MNSACTTLSTPPAGPSPCAAVLAKSALKEATSVAESGRRQSFCPVSVTKPSRQGPGAKLVDVASDPKTCRGSVARAPRAPRRRRNIRPRGAARFAGLRPGWRSRRAWPRVRQVRKRCRLDRRTRRARCWQAGCWSTARCAVWPAQGGATLGRRHRLGRRRRVALGSQDARAPAGHDDRERRREARRAAHEEPSTPIRFAIGMERSC